MLLFEVKALSGAELSGLIIGILTTFGGGVAFLFKFYIDYVSKKREYELKKLELQNNNSNIDINSILNEIKNVLEKIQILNDNYNKLSQLVEYSYKPIIRAKNIEKKISKIIDYSKITDNDILSYLQIKSDNVKRLSNNIFSVEINELNRDNVESKMLSLLTRCKTYLKAIFELKLDNKLITNIINIETLFINQLKEAIIFIIEDNENYDKEIKLETAILRYTQESYHEVIKNFKNN